MTLETGRRRWVYARSVGGRFQRLHRVSSAALQALLFVTPWVVVGGHPAVHADLPGRRLHLLGAMYSASDGFDLVLLALFAAFSLFLATSLFGRLWCGYACPQTVFLEGWIRPIEHLVEGDATARRRRDAGPWSADRAARKAAKWALFAALAVAVAGTAVSYFAGARALWTGAAGPVDYALTGIVAAGLFLDWAWFREQLCTYLCPYARFQGALTDDASLVISYDRARGEPRGKGKAAAEGGHCVDCRKCVEVCPAGIDIRDGFQLECIACARCIDACEAVMPKLGHPTLVRYSTIRADEGRPPRTFRPRTLVYAGLLATIGGALAWRLVAHEPLEVTVRRAPGSLFALDADGHVRNTFLVQVTNNDPDARHLYVISVHGLEAAQLSAAPVELAALGSTTVAMSVRLPAGGDRTRPFVVRVEEVGRGNALDRDATFKAPPPQELR